MARDRKKLRAKWSRRYFRLKKERPEYLKLKAKKAHQKLKEKGYFKTPEFKEKQKKRMKTPTMRFYWYRKGAKERKIEFTLSLKEFMEFWKKECSYCGKEIETIGLDRIDNQKGYEKENVASCCPLCNMMKKNLIKNDFLNHIEKIYQHNH